jgi:hypothetical protein
MASKKPPRPPASEDLSWMTETAPTNISDPLGNSDGLSLGDLLEDDPILTKRGMDEARRYTAKLKRSFLRAKNNLKIADFLTLPQPGEAVHYVSNGHYDYFFFCTHLLKLLGKPLDEFRAITWTCGESAVLELLRLCDAQLLGKVSVITSTYLKDTRDSAKALNKGLRARGHRYTANVSHSKIMLLKCPPHYLVLEGSANWTLYPGVEQNVLVNDQGLYEFHAEWMEEFFV